MIDTAGLRRKSKIEPDSIERYSVIRSLNAIERADVVVVVLDASEGITEQDVRILGLVHEQGKPTVVVVNKWDLIENATEQRKAFEKQFENDLAFMKYYVTLYVSCATGQRIGQIMEKVDYVLANAKREIPMALFNNVLTNAISATEPPSKHGKRKLSLANKLQLAHQLLKFIATMQNWLKIHIYVILKTTFAVLLILTAHQLKLFLKTKMKIKFVTLSLSLIMARFFVDKTYKVLKSIVDLANNF